MLIYIGIWEEEAVRKPVAGEGRVLCVLICIGIWEEETVCKPVACEDEKVKLLSWNCCVCCFW